MEIQITTKRTSHQLHFLFLGERERNLDSQNDGINARHVILRDKSVCLYFFSSEINLFAYINLGVTADEILIPI